MECPICHKINSIENIFCAFCGTRLSGNDTRIKKQKIWEKLWFKILSVLTIALLLILYLPDFFNFLLIAYGFYMILYLISVFFKSTQPLEFIVSTISSIMIYFGYIGVLYLYYIALKILFEGNFLLGLFLLIIGIPLLQLVPILINFIFLLIIIGPAYFLLDDLEKKYKSKIIY